MKQIRFEEVYVSTLRDSLYKEITLVTGLVNVIPNVFTQIILNCVSNKENLEVAKNVNRVFSTESTDRAIKVFKMLNAVTVLKLYSQNLTVIISPVRKSFLSS